MLTRRTVLQFSLYIWIKEGRKKGYMEVGESKAGISLWLDYMIINKIVWSIEGAYASRSLQKGITLAFQRSVNLEAQEYWISLD